jgi:hypothetical protein
MSDVQDSTALKDAIKFIDQRWTVTDGKNGWCLFCGNDMRDGHSDTCLIGNTTAHLRVMRKRIARKSQP